MIISDYLTAPKRTEEEARIDRYKQDLCALCLCIDIERERIARKSISTVYDEREAWRTILKARDEVRVVP